MTSFSTVSDEDVARLMSGDLDRDEAGRLLAAIVADPAARETLLAWSEQDRALSDFFSSDDDQLVPRRLMDIVEKRRVSPVRKTRWLSVRAAASMAALCLGFGGLLGWAASGAFTPGKQADFTERTNEFPTEAIQAHETYVVEEKHSVEVSTEVPYLMDWLSYRLGHDIVAPDLRAFGFQLLGGRVLPSYEGTAIFLMYEDAGKRRITIYATPNSGDLTRDLRTFAIGSLRSLYWSDGVVSYSLTGDLPERRLWSIAENADKQL
jgi:anti-sigma factor RsiW